MTEGGGELESREKNNSISVRKKMSPKERIHQHVTLRLLLSSHMQPDVFPTPGGFPNNGAELFRPLVYLCVFAHPSECGEKISQHFSTDLGLSLNKL